ncbi:hypothetical protein [Streptomyces sp. NPDC001165]|uniref:hypothetical protein n=1 Tax=Streptomyces sp. NPDC001165 TaxID=3364546 RepID=UPI003695CF15
MGPIAVPPPATDVITDLIDEHVRQLGGRFHSEYYQTHEPVGRHTTLGGATVETRVLARFQRHHSGERQRLVTVGAEARCLGHGCTEPSSGETLTDPVPLDTNRHEVAESALPHIETATRWAQAHAERCRAQTYTSR